MTAFDWVLLFIGAPWALLNSAAVIYASRHNVGYSVQPLFFAPYALLLFIVYRVWG